jgi:hypothetical protein
MVPTKKTAEDLLAAAAAEIRIMEPMRTPEIEKKSSFTWVI